MPLCPLMTQSGTFRAPPSIEANAGTFAGLIRLSLDMRGKCRLSGLRIAAAALAVAECVGGALIETALPTAAQAQSSGDLFGAGRGHLQFDKIFQNVFGSQNSRWQQRKPHRLPDSAQGAGPSFGLCLCGYACHLRIDHGVSAN